MSGQSCKGRKSYGSKVLNRAENFQPALIQYRLRGNTLVN